MNKSEIQAKISELKEEIKQLESKLIVKTGVFLGLLDTELRVLVLDGRGKLTAFSLHGDATLLDTNYIWLNDYTVAADEDVTYTNVQHVIVPATLERYRRANEV